MIDNKLSKKEVEYIAKLANIELSEEEKEKFSKQLTEILDYVDQLNEIDVKDTKPLWQVTGLSNVMKKDEIEEQNFKDKILRNAPQKKDDFVKVKAVF